MLKLKESNGLESNVIPMSEMKPLQVGIIRTECGSSGKIVMRTASIDNVEIIDLSEPRPNGCWIPEGYCQDNFGILVELFPKGESITIELFN